MGTVLTGDRIARIAPPHVLKPVKVLGISCYFHDAAACIYVDGRMVAAAEEERFTRLKHDARFPLHAIDYCLEQARIGRGDVDHVVFHEKPLRKFERILSSSVEGFPASFGLFRAALHGWLGEKLWVRGTIRSRVGFEGEPLYLEHHLSHAASAFLPSPFEKAAVLTIDGVGEWATTTIGRGSGLDVELLKEIHFPHSLGLLYSVITGYLGFEPNDGEYKVMALAASGQPSYTGLFQDILRRTTDGSYRLNMRFFDYHRSLNPWTRLLERSLGPSRRPDGPLEQRHADIAATLQASLEDAVVGLADAAHSEVGGDRLTFAGGVALNVLANREILRRSRFREMFIPPAPGDSGAALGAAAYVSHSVLGLPRSAALVHPFLGPGYSDLELKRFLDASSIAYERAASDEEMLERVAGLLSDGKVIGWFRGRMEFGPRALGARSILANAADPRMKDLVNEKIKYREPFRPFGPAVTRESVSRYFGDDIDSPFMLLVATVLPEYADRISAVTHVDGTARVQTVDRQVDPLFHSLLERVGRRTGIPMVLNTSFNVRGEPIVCTPEDAFRCFSSTALDSLVLWPFLVHAGAKRAAAPRPVEPRTDEAWLA